MVTTKVSLERYQGTAFWIALIVFVAVYILIAFEILHRTLAAFLGATVLLVITHTLGNLRRCLQDPDVRTSLACR